MKGIAPFAAAAAALWGVAFGQSAIEKLVAPGDLSAAHEASDATCNSCHTPFDKAGQAALCLDCHDDVAADAAGKRGFHGRAPAVAGAACKNCHSEHRGAAFDIAAFDRRAFDHKLTDYPLSGGHARVPCEECHKDGKKFRDAPGACVACHEADDVHKGELGRECASCHAVADWKTVRFDHSKTKFPLLGAHRATQCAACHVDRKFKGIETACIACHRADDQHKGAFGNDCGACHVADSWTARPFDHAARTGFALLGGHRTILCAACHTKTLTEPKLARDCYSCHRKDDSHKGRNGVKCASCHSEESWKGVRFDHTKTRFPLRGAHKAVECAACHVEPVTKSLPGLNCIDCHRADDPHKGTQGDACATCHSETSWKEKVRFDHDLSAFPLLGKHKAVACSACHLTQEFKSAPVDCVSCHREDDAHSGTLGGACERCHNPSGWSYWSFDHDVETDFPLTGAHVGLNCAACHRIETEKNVRRSSACISCHRADDKHRGQYGAACDRCHTTDSFDKIRIR